LRDVVSDRWYVTESFKKLGRQVKRFECLVGTSKQGGLRGSAYEDFHSGQAKEFGKRTPMDFVPRSPVIAYNVRHISLVEFIQSVYEFLIRYTFVITLVLSIIYALVWRVHVYHVG